MKKILFHTYTLNFRGTTNAVVDYAEYNQQILGNQSTLIYDPTFDNASPDIRTEQKTLDALSKRFEILTYNSNDHINDIAARYDLFYSMRAGVVQEPMVTTTKTAIHAVFTANQPHGDRYAYISEWLSAYCSNYTIPYVPYIVDLPQPHPLARHYLRHKYGIKPNQFVFGRIGGIYTFDLPFSQQAVIDIVNRYPDIVFFFVNTHKFYEHPNIIYLDPFFDNQFKSNYISACDAMLHGRERGESFGSAVCEFLFHNKPVLAWEGGIDQNHVLLLKDYNLLYNEHNVYEKILELTTRSQGNYNNIVAPFTPQQVMQKFDQVFIR